MIKDRIGYKDETFKKSTFERKEKSLTTITGKVTYILKDKNGEVKQKGESHNLVVSVGDQYIADRFLIPPTITPVNCIVLGTGWSEPAKKSDVWVNAYFPDNGHNVTGEGKFDSGYPKIINGSPNRVEVRATIKPGYATRNGLNEMVVSNTDPNSDGSRAGGIIVAHGELDPVVNKAVGDELKVIWETTFLGVEEIHI